MGEAALRIHEEGSVGAPAAGLRPPAWAFELAGGLAVPWLPAHAGMSLRAVEGDQFSMVSVVVPNAVSLGATELEQRTEAAYRLIGERLRAGRGRQAVRVWNFIPGILAPLGELPHRYMAFNAGRFKAYESWFGGREGFRQRVPTASGVGHLGSDLSFHCLASNHIGTPIENPRQVPSYRYSERYGPLPPCFARATRVTVPPDAGTWLLVGGTASVRGEETVNAGNLDAQAAETFQNMAELVAAAGDGVTSWSPTERQDRRFLLGRFQSLRVYYVQREHEERVRQLVGEAFPESTSFEFTHAELCRARLLVEIEGVAALS